MKRVRKTLSISCLLAAIPNICSADGRPSLGFDQAISLAITSNAKVSHDPFNVFGFRQRLPDACLRTEIAPAIEEGARKEFEYQQTIETASLFFKIQGLENSVLAAGEKVAATYGEWQRLKARATASSETISNVELIQAESTYLNALAYRENLRVHLRREYSLLAGLIGEQDSISVELVSDLPVFEVSTAVTKPTPRRKEIALTLLGEWWASAPKKFAALRSICSEKISLAIKQEKSESQRLDDISQLQISYLSRYAIPAAEIDLRLAEVRLDQARSNEPGAPPLGKAMTDSLLAAGAVRAAQNQLHLEQLRLMPGL